MNYLQTHWREIGEYVALAGGWAVILSRVAWVYDAIVNHGGLVGIVKSLLLGSAKDVTLKPTPAEPLVPTPPEPPKP